MTTHNQGKALEEVVAGFPEAVRKILGTVFDQAGWMNARQCAQATEELDISTEALMVRLLPLAQIYAVAPVSGFRAGAVALVSTGNGSELYLGANMEFENQPLVQTIHAEQAAVMNAWHQGAVSLVAVAASAPPCGYCRQFLYEPGNSGVMRIIIPTDQEGGYQSVALRDLLPKAFGPADLGSPHTADPADDSIFRLKLKHRSDDPVILAALEAARKAYAPYSHNAAGSAVEMATGGVFSGRYVETAAFNPCLSPLQAAALRINMNRAKAGGAIKRVVLVERPTFVRQQETVAMLLKSLAPGLRLEYREAVQKPAKRLRKKP